MSEVLECQELKKFYHDGTRELRVLRGVNLTVHDHEIIAISGPSGVGKSTLLHLMGTLDRPTAGRILFRGHDLARARGRRLNRIRSEELGFVFQFYHLLPEFTALENVMMPALCRGKKRSACKGRAAELLDKVGLAERMSHKPGQLSGGEQQRAAIARALFNNPGVVLADEPTGNLDEKTGEGIIDLLWRLNETDGITLVIVSHDEAIAVRAHRWVHLHDGVVFDRTGERPDPHDETSPG